MTAKAQSNTCSGCGKSDIDPTFYGLDGMPLCADCWKKEHDKAVSTQMNAANEMKQETALTTCKNYRRSLKLPEENDLRNMRCSEDCGMLDCYKGCPLPKDQRGKGVQTLAAVTHVEEAKEMPAWSYPLQCPDNKAKICKRDKCPKNATCPHKKQRTNKPSAETEQEPRSPKEKPFKISKETEDFLWMQSRVIDKLNRHPELWKILDKFYWEDIVEKLVGKSSANSVPVQLGGTMKVEVSKKTKDMFAKLEKQFEEEDKVTGKQPHDFGENGEREVRGQSLIEVLEGHEDVVHGNKHDWITCPTCHGTGKTPSGRWDCLRCGGIGRIQSLRKPKEEKKNGKQENPA